MSEIEGSSSEYKALLTNLFIQKVVLKEVKLKDETSRECLLIYIPYPCLKALKDAHQVLVPELEHCLEKPVIITAIRKIQSRWRKIHKSQKRPFSRTLTSVHNAILEDMVYPSEIIGRRERYRVNGSRFHKM